MIVTTITTVTNVALLAQPGDDCGNLAVWPRSHLAIHEAVKTARAANEQRPDIAWSGAAYDDQAFWGSWRPRLGAVPLHLTFVSNVTLHHVPLTPELRLLTPPHGTRARACAATPGMQVGTTQSN